MDVFRPCGNVQGNNMPDIVRNFSFEKNDDFDLTAELLSADNDFMMEQILDNINNTPLGQVLKKIASLPEIRKEKVLGVRRQLTEGNYDLDHMLDLAVDKVLEDLTA